MYVDRTSWLRGASLNKHLRKEEVILRKQHCFRRITGSCRRLYKTTASEESSYALKTKTSEVYPLTKTVADYSYGTKGERQINQQATNQTLNANIAEHHDFSDWSFQAEDASISNSALMADDSSSSNKVNNKMCSPEYSETLTIYKKINSQLCNELESLQVVKANFFEVERNYKEKIDEMEKTISSLKHEDTNKQCQIKNLLERLTTAKTELVLAESYRDKFLSQGEKYEKLFRMSSTTELVNKHGAGLGYNKVEPPSAYTSIADVRCKPLVDLVYNEMRMIFLLNQ
ncbi:hypothetical protein E3N88_12933 [Mikania micrantha]|uniref:Uncharacterized protein n=1 Tax=Mikania micrantha TaxID=192012 RepID=A0A5N6P8X3_9ASTR|nr:hypothetical protein E3N88_12933 [Mikania micrantha]